ncbi:MAG: biopolymer transporter ExbD [Chitinophagaceae bacterium]
MPSVKIPKKSTDTDMTPFVDVAFLILSFFMLATKFKPPEPVEVKTPNSVSADKLKESDAIWITIDKDSKVYFSVSVKGDKGVFKTIAEGINTNRNLNLTPAEVTNLGTTLALSFPVGVPFAGLKQLLARPPQEMGNVAQPGIPVLDTLNNELIWWLAEAKKSFAGKKGVLFLIKGDGISKFPTFEGVVNALKKNEEFKYNLITSPEDAPAGSALAEVRSKPSTE